MHRNPLTLIRIDLCYEQTERQAAAAGMDLGAILKCHGEHHMQVYEDLPLLLPLLLALLLDAAGAAQSVHTLNGN